MHTIKIKTQFNAFHRWKDAPDDVSFLRDYHRHIFFVKLEVQVEHDNRDIEFFTIKKALDRYIELRYKDKKFDYGCEAIAEDICEEFDGWNCCVFEDNENGGCYYNTNIKL